MRPAGLGVSRPTWMASRNSGDVLREGDAAGLGVTRQVTVPIAVPEWTAARGPAIDRDVPRAQRAAYPPSITFHATQSDAFAGAAC